MIINVEFIGALRTLAGAATFHIELEEPSAVFELLQKMSKEIFKSEAALLYSTLIILKNGLEISVLNGVHTKLNHQDTITLIPTSHGG